MRRMFLFVLLICTFCLPSFGQIREIYDDGEIIEGYDSGIFLRLGDAMFSYRLTYGRYPDDKKVLLDYFLECSKIEKDFYSDSTTLSVFAEIDSILTVDLNAPENVLTVSGDTCTFSYARAMREYSFYDLDDTVAVVKKLSAVQCIGGPVEQQMNDYWSFRAWARSRFYDKDGKLIWSLNEESPKMRKEVNGQFRYLVTMGPDEDDLSRGEPVLVPITVTRSGVIDYNKDISCLKGVQLYYQEYGKPFSTKSAIGTITLEEAIDPDRLDAIKAYMKGYFDEHEEVERAELWELVMFNHLPKGYASQKDDLTGLSVY